MMTKEQYIDYWVDTAQKDWIAVESMFDTKNIPITPKTCTRCAPKNLHMHNWKR